ncbi:hypothetical protein CRX57_08965 [Pseudomonas putida]|uniref:Uncharacterized protein n=1 Tax=Pseudomonas putida TaxID=303 RepID=A0A2C5W6S3_PSEPU|nr:hypothetical protein CRX57_08965 [Pseudomonas putida]
MPDTNQTVGVGLLTKRPAHSASMLTDLTLSRASPLPQGGRWVKYSGLVAIQGGSGLAHEEAGPFSIIVD